MVLYDFIVKVKTAVLIIVKMSAGKAGYGIGTASVCDAVCSSDTFVCAAVLGNLPIRFVTCSHDHSPFFPMCGNAHSLV